MFSAFLRFELRFWLRSLMVYVFLAIMTLMIMSVTLSDDAVVSLIFQNAYHNSPFAVQQMYAATAVLGCLMVAAFVNAAASRDFTYDTHQLIFSKPISKPQMLLGRFLGAMLVSLLPMLGASLGILISQLISQQGFENETLWGPTYWSAHFWGLVVFAAPNIFFLASIVFAIAIWTRSTLASFAGIIGLMVAVSIASAAVAFLDNQTLTAMLDPFGGEAFNAETKYWTVAEKNSQSLGFEGLMLWNRLLWVAVGGVFFLLGYVRFRLTNVQRANLLSRMIEAAREHLDRSLRRTNPPTRIPQVQQSFGVASNLARIYRQAKLDFLAAVKSPTFIVVMIGLVLALSIILAMGAAQGFGLKTLPVTFTMAEGAREALLNFTVGLVTFYTGVFVWKERDARLDEVYDACPQPTWIPFTAKFIAMVLIMVIALVTALLVGVLVQVSNGHFQIDWGLYFSELLVLELLSVVFMIVLAMFVQVLSPNKYVGFFAFIVLLIGNQIAWALLKVETNMVRYGDLSSYVYSDMFGYGPFAKAIFWFAVYWSLFAGLLATATVLLWPRGKETAYRVRFREAATRWRGGTRWGSLALAGAWLIAAGWVYYNTMVLNTLQNEPQQLAKQSEYETKYKSNQNTAQPRITKIRYDIDIYPEVRRVVMRGRQTLLNKSDGPIDHIFLTSFDDLNTTIEIDGATLAEKDEQLNHWTFALDPPLKPAESREMRFTVEYEARGFENSVSIQQIVQNGTFFNNMIAPQIGYQPLFELTDDKKRKRLGLPEQANIPELDPQNLTARGNHYISNNSDWVDVETVISTSDDQIAIAPGSLKKQWEENGRRFFHYELDHPSLNFYSFVSARYAVAVREWNGIEIEVFYHPDHKWNVDRMLKAVRSSLEYYTEHFGPYKHNQARIIEFPRTSSFAQAFPGTMPYSEGVGFIADIGDEDDIDMVFYVTAHEMAHQWWAHQVIGAHMRGATVLSETLAQYSSLMVMEKEFGRDMMRKFLRYEMENYLRGRGREQEGEFPLREVEATQGYVHYNKGSVVMYHLREMIGEDAVNAALKALIDKFGYADRPYPTSQDLIDELRKVTPPEYQYLLEDSFNQITLYANRTEKAEYRRLENGKFEVTIQARFAKLYADAKGSEQSAELNDWIEVGAFAKPKSGEKFGKTLYRERLRINQPEREIKFVVDKIPHRVGVDPFSLLIDRDPADNLREPQRAK